MNPYEKRAIYNYLHRHRWAFSLGALFHFFTIVYNYESGSTHNSWSIPLLGIIPCGGILLGLELRVRGNSATRTFLTLPLSVNQLANVWRYVGLIFPIALLFIVLVAASIFAEFFNIGNPTFSKFITTLYLQNVFLGLFFFALTGIRSAAFSRAPMIQNLSNLFFRLLWGFSIPALIYFPALDSLQTPKAAKIESYVMIFLAIVTIAGFFRAKSLVLGQAMAKKLPPQKRSSSKKQSPKSWSGFGGIPYYFASVGPLSIALFVFISGLSLLVVEKVSGQPNLLVNPGEWIQLNIILVTISMTAVFQFLPMLKVARILPLKTATLAGLLIFIPLFFILLLCAIALGSIALIRDLPFNWTTFLACSSASSTTLLIIPFFLRFGITLWGIFLLIAVTIYASFFNASFGLAIDPDFSTYLHKQVLLAVAAVGSAWAISSRLLRSDHPWRTNQFDFGFRKASPL